MSMIVRTSIIHPPFKLEKSLKHSDGELCFSEGWFIVVAELPTGQISNHYKVEDMDLFFLGSAVAVAGL
jgi:hypothetical protein